MELEEYIEKLAATREGLEETVREAHQLNREMKQNIKDFRKIRDEIKEEIENFAISLDETLNQKVKEGLDKYSNAFDEAIALATKAVDKRFTTIVDILLGEDPKSKRVGKKPIAELVQEHVRGENILREREAGVAIASKSNKTLPPGLRRKKP
jgi:chromosome segregation ATPase